MGLVEGVHHTTFLTEDIDRLTAFYERVVDARKTLDMTEESVRHVYLEVGPTTVLHPFQILDGPALPSAPGTMFQRGRLDHFGLNAASEEAFRELRLRIVAEGAGDGMVTDMGSLLNFGFTDPDGGRHEVIWVKPGVPVEAGLKRADWTTVEMH